jgi:transposase
MSLDHHFAEPTAIRTNLGAIFVSLELSRSTWLITSLSPGGGEKMSKHGLSAGNIAALLARLSELKQKAFARTGQSFQVIVIQEAGLDGFWIHRVLQSEGIESHVVDAASIATSRRRRRAKTDKIDGEALVRALLAYKRGEPRVCAMVRAPTPEEEDRRRLCRERKTLTNERVQHVNRIKGLNGIGPEFAAVLWSEGFYRSFANRKQVAAYAGLAPTPWQSGSIAREQGVSKAGNPRLRTTLLQLAWLWLRHQPQSALARWFHERVTRNGGRLRKSTIVALARKLLVALWKYVTARVVIDGAVVRAA